MPMPFHPAQPTQTLPPKLLVTTIALVLGLHIGVGIGLMNMPALTIKPTNITAPLEVKFIELPKPIEPKPTEPKPVEPKPVIQSKPEPQVATTRHIQQKAVPKKVTQATLPKTAPKPISDKIEKVDKQIQPMTKPVTKPAPPINESKPAVSVSQHMDPQIIAAQQAQQIAQQQAQAERAEQARQVALRVQADNERRAEIARQQAQAAQQKNEAARIAKEQAEKQRLAQETLVQEKLARDQAEKERAERERAEKQQAEKAAQAKKAAENSQPIQFGNGDAAWRSKPNLKFSGNLARIIDEENLNNLSIKINVNSKGNVTAVTITRSSGNSQIDNVVKQRLFSAKLQPFIRNGVAVDGIGNLTVTLN